MLPNGDLMIDAFTTPQCDIFDPVTNIGTPAASKAVRPKEETWILLPDDSIITASASRLTILNATAFFPTGKVKGPFLPTWSTT